MARVAGSSSLHPFSRLGGLAEESIASDSFREPAIRWVPGSVLKVQQKKRNHGKQLEVKDSLTKYRTMT